MFQYNQPETVLGGALSPCWCPAVPCGPGLGTNFPSLGTSWTFRSQAQTCPWSAPHPGDLPTGSLLPLLGRVGHQLLPPGLPPSLWGGVHRAVTLTSYNQLE